MLRIAGVQLPSSKQIRFALSIIKGIGKVNAKTLLDEAKIPYSKKVEKITEEEAVRLRTIIEEKYTVEEDLMRKVQSDIAHHVRTGTYRGIRHKKGLPVRGQTTRTNSRTRRGNVRKTAGSGRVKAADLT